MYREMTVPFQESVDFKPRQSSGGVSQVNVVSLRDIKYPIRVRARVFVFVRSSRSRLHGHDHEDSAFASEIILSSLHSEFFSNLP